MVRTYQSFPITDLTATKRKMLNYLGQFSIFCFLDSHQYNLPLHSQECLAGAGVHAKMHYENDDPLPKFDEFIYKNDDWIFGNICYDLKSSLFSQPSRLPGGIYFPVMFFYVPQIVIQLNKTEIIIGSLEDNHAGIFKAIQSASSEYGKNKITVSIRERLSKNEYTAIIEALRKHIIRGDCYEINYCMEFFAENVVVDPAAVYQSLGKISPSPFSGYYRWNDQYLMCSSPERYLRKEGSNIISQPIKGTAPRQIGDYIADNLNKELLYQSAKDRSENVMVVDLVRNDFSRICREGTVKVDELFGIYSFPQVHQMISTISGELQPGVTIGEIIQATFPMGSMTGAPKIRVMELIEKYEKSRRGLFSGAIGYITPGKNLDFNVVIRSILYNESSRYLSLPAGSGITYYSNAEQEYNECILKAEAMLKALTSA